MFFAVICSIGNGSFGKTIQNRNNFFARNDSVVFERFLCVRRKVEKSVTQIAFRAVRQASKNFDQIRFGQRLVGVENFAVIKLEPSVIHAIPYTFGRPMRRRALIFRQNFRHAFFGNKPPNRCLRQIRFLLRRLCFPRQR